MGDYYDEGSRYGCDYGNENSTSTAFSIPTMAVAALVRVVSSFLCCGTDEAMAACNSLIKSPSQSMLRPVAYLMLRTIFQKDPLGYLKGKCVDVYPRMQLLACAKKCPPESQLFCLELLKKVVDGGMSAPSDSGGDSLVIFETSTREVRAFCFYLIGGMYLWEIGCEKDLVVAFKYFCTGTELGCHWCENILGGCLQHGWGVEKNPERALQCFQNAREKGNPCATQNIGDYYFHHNARADSIPLYEASAASGNAIGMLMLGFCYRKGEGGLPKDPHKAERYMQAAASQGTPEAQHGLGVLYEYGDIESKGIQDAVRLYFLGAAQDSGEAQHGLGCFYWNRNCLGGVWRRDIRESTRWYRLSLSNGCFEAKKELREILDKYSNT